MPAVDVSEVLAALSRALIGSQLLQTERIVRFEAPNRLVFRKNSAFQYASSEQFWSMMEGNCEDGLSSERRRDIFHQFQRRRACHLVTKVALMALKILNEDKGLRIEHRGRAVTNVLGMNSQALDVSDIVGMENSMLLVDAETEEEMQLIATEHEMEKRSPVEFSANVRQRHADPDRFTEYCGVPPSERIPHWWVGITCEGEGVAQIKESAREEMVHMDMMCAAFGEFSYAESGGQRVPLHIFASESPWMRPGDDVKEGHKFHLTEWAASEGRRTISFDASVRHFRAYTRKKGGFIEASPLKHILAERPEWDTYLHDGAAIATQVALAVFADKSGARRPGTELVISGLQKRPELNGKRVAVEDAEEIGAGAEGSGRVGVRVVEGGGTVRVKLLNLKCVPGEDACGQIQTLAAMKKAFAGAAHASPEEVRKALEPKPRAAGRAEVTDVSQMQDGSFVRIVGLQSAAGSKLNRRVGTVRGLAPDGERWEVVLQPEGATKGVKAGNLEVLGHPESRLSEERRNQLYEAFRARLSKDGRLERLYGQVQLGLIKFTAYENEGVRDISQLLVELEYFRCASEQLHFDHCRLHFWAAEHPCAPRARAILAEFQERFFKEIGGRRVFDPSLLAAEASRQRCIELHKEVTSTPDLRLVFKWLKSEGLLRLPSDVLLEQNGCEVLGERLDII